MDLSSMLNDGPEPEKKPSHAPSPDVHRNSAHFLPPNASGANGSSNHSTPHYAQSGTNSVPPPNPALTPQRPSSQTPSGAQYTYPPQQHQYQQHPSQSPVPVAHPGQPYPPPHTPYAAGTPGPRGSNSAYPQPQPSPSRYPSSVPQGLHHQHHTTSLSPTPPSHHSPNSQSVRQSPLSVVPGQQQPPPMQQHYQHSQPSTPLGPPPPLHYQRGSGQSHHEAQSPYHSRTMSGASNGFVSGSPAQHHPNIANLVESPSAHSRNSSNVRRTSDYLNQLDRERSLSVSPKTKVPARPPSHGSRQSSLHEVHSAHSNSTPTSEHQNHMSQPSPGPGGPQATIHHQPHKMDMNRLLSPTMNGGQPPAPPSVRKEPSGIFMKPSPKPKKPAVAAPPQPQENPAGAAVQQTTPQQRHISIDHSTDSPENAQPKTTVKRSAESDLSSEPPLKRGKMRKYAERPAWARLARNNPRIDDLQGQQGGASRSISHQSLPQTSQAQPPPAAVPQPNGQSTNGNTSSTPWLQNPPLDQDLINTRNIMGPWEKTVRWNTPYPDLLKAVQDWLFQQLDSLREIGDDPLEGAIEIEAKIGQIMRRGTDERLQLPIQNAAVLAPQFCDQIRFESQMDIRAFEAMNKFLNTTIRETLQPGRVAMKYEHPKETDSFRTLSAIGYQTLPQVVQRRKLGRELRLRTSTDNKTGEVKARIVKIGLSDLHIYNPTGEYDCRISINLETNLNRPDLNPAELSEEPTFEKPAAPDRRKDRLSYKHLAYSIDLTKVEVSNNMQPKYELELEVDAHTLREQMRRMLGGEQHAFGEVVSGFVDNATFLMRQKPNAA